MVAFQISINGKPYCESVDITTMTIVADEIRRDGYRISLHAAGPDTPVQWFTANMSVGDEILIRVVDPVQLEEDLPPLICSFCGKDANDVHSLITGSSAAICDDCIGDFSAAVKDGRELPLGASLRDEPQWVCGLCANQPGVVPGVVVRNGAAVCPECLRVCSDLLASRSGSEDDVS